LGFVYLGGHLWFVVLAENGLANKAFSLSILLRIAAIGERIFFLYLFVCWFFVWLSFLFFYFVFMRVCQPRRLQNLENYMQAATHYARRDNNISIGEKLHT